MDLSGYTMRKIRQNLFWAFIYNSAGIPIAAGVLFPFTGFLLNPVIAGVAMALSSISVVTNALSMRRYRSPLSAYAERQWSKRKQKKEVRENGNIGPGDGRRHDHVSHV
jgi:hypothetical protein